MNRKTLVATACLALAAASVPDTAEAQIGGALRRAAQRRAEQAAAKKIAGSPDSTQRAADSAAAPAAAAPGAPAGRERPAPMFDGRTLELTPPVVDRFLRALAAEAPARAALAADRAKEGQYRATIDRYERCQERVMERQQAEMESRSEDPKMMEWQLRYVRAMMTGDTVTVRQVTDSLLAAGFRPDSTCGRRPAEAFQGVNRIENSEREIDGTAADAGEFSIEQYAVMKERVIPWAQARKAGRQLRAGFTAGEQAALEAKSAEILAGLRAELEAGR